MPVHPLFFGLKILAPFFGTFEISGVKFVYNYGRSKQGDSTAEDGRNTEHSLDPYAEAYLPRFAKMCLVHH